MKIWFAAALLLMAPAQAFAEGEPLPPPPVPKTKAASNDISGRWLYRSVQNNPDFDATPESLRLAVAVLDIKPFKGKRFEGTLTSAYWTHRVEGEVKGNNFTMRAFPGDHNTQGWFYDYVGSFAPQWEGSPDQLRTFTGSVRRATAHAYRLGGVSEAGATYSFYGVKQP